MLLRAFATAAVALFTCYPPAMAGDWLRDLQAQAVATKHCDAAHWGPDASQYSTWTDHSNRLIPVYTFGTAGGPAGIDLTSYTGVNSPYRDGSALTRIYHENMDSSVSELAEYMDQTNIFDLQLAALKAGKKNIILVVFDGTDWQTTQAASIVKLGRVAYTEGRGTGLHFQDYTAGGTSQFGWMVTSPQRSKAQVEVDTQTVRPSGGLPGGYSELIAGPFPWSTAVDSGYLIANSQPGLTRHAYTDSASSATSMCCGIKTYNGAIGLGPAGRPHTTIAEHAQAAGYRVGVVTNVPISHATPGAAYAKNVTRNDYQDISRDLLGLPSVSHPDEPMPGLDVAIGTGWGVELDSDESQGTNFVPGNKYLTDRDLKQLQVANGGQYVAAARTAGVNGAEQLAAAAAEAAASGRRLLGFYGVGGTTDHVGGHLPYASADGQFDPAPGVDGLEFHYTSADLVENPTLADMAKAALTVLTADDRPFWLMLEAGDVDWANHRNNLDASVGAVLSGDAAVKTVTDWVEQHSNWDDTVVIVTADHGHYLVLDRPELLICPTQREDSRE